MNSRKTILLVIVALAFSLSAAYFFISRTARYAFYRVGKAIRTHDVESFATYMDVDAVVDEWVAWGAQEAKQELLDMKSDLENPLGEGMIELMMPNLRMKLKEEFKRSLLQNVETGMLTGGLPLLNMVLLPIEKIEVTDKVAAVQVKHPQKDERIFFKLRFLPQGYWRIVSIKIPSLMRSSVAKKNRLAASPATSPQPPAAQQPSLPGEIPGSNEAPFPSSPQMADPQEAAATSLQRDYVLTRTMVYAEYYQKVRDAISRKVAVYGNKGYKGQVELKLVLLPQGKIKSVSAEQSPQAVNKHIKELALKAAKDASPYPAFPQELLSPEETFNILISFE